jgi:hypothetical protein
LECGGSPPLSSSDGGDGAVKVLRAIDALRAWRSGSDEDVFRTPVEKRSQATALQSALRAHGGPGLRAL